MKTSFLIGNLLLAAVLAALVLLASCGGGGDNVTPTASPTVASSPTGPTPTRTPVNVPITKEINVFAASSLTAAFTQLASDFEALNPGVGVNLTFGGSQQLRAQIGEGAKADVFASADREQIDAAASTGLVIGIQELFATNRLAIIVPKANTANISRPQDLARDGLKIIIGGEAVPVGKYARQFLAAASANGDFSPDYKDRVLANVVSEATNVKEIVSAVQLGEVDAGIVYVTDVTPDIAGAVTTIQIPDSVNQTAQYVMSLTYLGASKDAAQVFIDYVNNDVGQATLAQFGFGPGTP